MTRARFFYLVTANSHYRLPAETWRQYLWRMLFRRGKRIPTGGVKVIYQHCDLLRANGFTAQPVHLGDFTVDWMDHHCMPIKEADARVIASAIDILVVPERIPQAASAFQCREKVVFVQNGGYVDNAVAGRRYEDFGFTSILCCSQYVSDFMASRSDLPRHVVTNGIRLDLFRPKPETRKKNTVLYLKRKSSWHLGSEVIALLPADVRRTIEVIELENQFAEAEMAAYYQQSDIFIALGFPEGFALPPLEAMACGCVVVGFTGGGGSQFMKDGETALIVPDGDAKELSRALQRILNDETLKETLRRGGLAKSQEFTIKAMEQELIGFATRISHAVAKPG